MKNKRSAGLIIAAALAMVTASNVPVMAAGEKDWPCIQRKVPTLSLGNYWQGPAVDPATAGWRDDAEVTALVSKIVSRRTPLEEAQKLVTDFAAKAGPGKQAKLPLVFAGVFSELNTLRSTVIAGIDRYVKAQRSRAEEIATVRNRIRDLFGKDGRTPEENQELAKLQQQLQWQVRIYEEKESARIFICEVPVLLEQRVYALAQSIQNGLS